MPDWMAPFRTVGNILQKPQSVATGVLSEITGQADDARRFIDQYEMALVDDTEENALRYKAALQMVGDSEQTGGSVTNIGSILSGAARGARSNIRPSDLLVADSGDQESLGAKISTNAANIAIDPLMLVGGAGGVPKVLQGTKAEKLLKAAGTLGPLGEDASVATKAAQYARRGYQGTLASGGDPLLALSTALGIGTAERAGSALLAKLGGKVADDLVSEGTERALSSRFNDTMQGEYEAALRRLGPEAQTLTPGMGAQGPGFEIPQTRVAPGMELEPWQPGAVPPLNANPRVAAAREMIAGQAVTNPRQLNQSPLTFRGSVDANEVMGQLAKEYSVGPSRGGLRQREVYGPLDRTQVPYSDQGLFANVEAMGNGIPTRGGQSALPPGSVGNNLPAPSPFAGIERLPEELIRRPVAPTQAPDFERLLEADPEFLRQMATEFLAQRPVQPALRGIGGRPVGVQPRDNRFLPAALREASPSSIMPEEAMAVLEEVKQVPLSAGASPTVRNMPLEKQAEYYRRQAERGSAKAREKYLAIMAQLDAQTEDPVAKFLRLAGG